MDKTTVAQDDGSRFMIVKYDDQDETETFFAGFCNEVEGQGTEDESFCWEIERWVERPEDGAVMFKHLVDARDFLDVLDGRCHCSIVLYGKGDVENTMLGSYWYPLKTFH